jgi:nicotinamidase/pyrazinamidase
MSAVPSKPLAGSDALLVIDVQQDFLPGGPLPVPQGDTVVPRLNEWAMAFSRAGCPVYATRDWHPANHCSFRAQGGPWPPHCVASTAGAGFAAGLELPAGTITVSKASRSDADAYSGFDGTTLADRLRAAGTSRVWVGGLATDYCVRATVMDALRLGFGVTVLTDAIRGVDVTPGDGARALAEMQAAGAVLRAGGPQDSGP